MKKTVSLILAFVLCLSAGMTALAYGSGENYLSYGVTGGNIYFDPQTGVITSSDYYVTHMNIPNAIEGYAVTRIGDGAFWDLDNLREAAIAEGIVSIGESAFRRCRNLLSITLPASVTDIADKAFFMSDNIRDVYYGGTRAEWDKITVGSDNAPLDKAVFHFSDETSGVLTVGNFTDVPRTAYFAGAVQWALGKEITTGMTETSFGPELTVTRGQAVTFLWRAAGMPEPEPRYNPFYDVPEGAYYYKAILWAAEKGITTGTSETTFSPEDNVLREQMITFQWRAAGKPLPEPAPEPAPDANYYDGALAWAEARDLLKDTEFTVGEPCPRSDVVLYLWREMG